MEEKIKTKKSFIFPIVLVLIVILILVGYWWKKKRIAPMPTPPEKPAEKIIPKEDSVTSISQDLEALEILNLDREFSDIDQDLNSL